MTHLLAEGGYQSFLLTSSTKLWLYFAMACAVVAIVVALLLVRGVLAADTGTASMQDIAKAIQEGAEAFLSRQFKTIGIIIVPLAVLIFFTATSVTHTAWVCVGGLTYSSVHLGCIPHQVTDLSRSQAGIYRVICFLAGAICSGLTGFIGMSLAVRGNVRTAAAARDGKMAPALKVAYRTGAITGLLCVGLGLLGATTIVLIFQNTATAVLIGFGFGASLLALFMRVGGGIFTKAADVGADLVGKVEAGIPEDDPRNAATIADNVGDNVGDCAGMAADLFESYAVTLVAALILGQAAFGEKGLVFPLMVPAIGALTAILGVYITKPRPGENGLVAINRGFYISAAVSAVLSTVAAFLYLPSSFAQMKGLPTGANGAANPILALSGDPRLVASLTVILGVVLAAIILWLTGHFTGTDKRPTMDVARTSLTGAATVVLSGIGVGLESAVYTAVIIGGAMYLAFLLGAGSVVLSLFLIALTGCGLLTTVGVIVAMDTFGPVSDNAQGIAEMSGDVHGDGVQVLTELDAVGNTTKAITKGIAIATAVLAATALFGSYTDAWQTELTKIATKDKLQDFPSPFVKSMFDLQIVTPSTLVGLLIGASVVFLFSGLAINAVTRSAGAIVF